LYAKRERGALENPNRLIELVRRVEGMIETFQRGESEFTVDGDVSIALIELDRLLSHYENTQELLGFADVGATLVTTQDYAHTFVSLDAARFLDTLGNGRVEFVAKEDAATPDLRVCTQDGSWSWHVEVHVPRELVTRALDRSRWLEHAISSMTRSGRRRPSCAGATRSS
jgi:hypothetical protein